MARRRLLSDDAWAAVMALPSDERDLVQYCTMSAEDLDRLRGIRTPHNRLGHALSLCAMRYPGRTLAPGERPPATMIAWVARQLGVEAEALSLWSNRAQTRREQIGDIMKAHGFMTFGRDEAVAMMRWLTPTAQIERRPRRLIDILLAELPNDDAIIRLVGALMLETNDEWAVARRYMSLLSWGRGRQ